MRHGKLGYFKILLGVPLRVVVGWNVLSEVLSDCHSTLQCSVIYWLTWMIELPGTTQHDKCAVPKRVPWVLVTIRMSNNTRLYCTVVNFDINAYYYYMGYGCAYRDLYHYFTSVSENYLNFIMFSRHKYHLVNRMIRQCVLFDKIWVC